MSTRPSCSLHLLLARDAPIGAIFRRGPSKWVRLVKWNTDRDTFKAGQWLQGRIYPDRSDLSPDGELLLYFGGDFKFHQQAKGTWTAISKLPYFTALMLWPQGDCWGGGGFFVDNRSVCIGGPPIMLPRPRVKVRRYAGKKAGDWQTHEALNGWTREELVPKKKWRRTKAQPNGAAIIESVVGSRTFTLRVADGAGNTLLDLTNKTTIADWDHRGRLVHGNGGELLATTFGKRTVSTRILADFSPMQFESIPPPPHALVW